MYIPNSRERGNQVAVRNFITNSASVALGFITNNQACFNALSRALCVHYYLPCGSNGTIHVPQFLCPEVCDYLVNDVCKNEWPLLVSGFQNHVDRDTIGVELPICSNPSQIISYLNLSNDCCSDAGIVVPSSASTFNSTDSRHQSPSPMITSTYDQQTPIVMANSNTLIIISTSIAGSIVLLVALSVAILVLVLLLKWKTGKEMHSSKR